MQRTVYGPDRDLLTARECAAWLGVGLTLFRALVSSGQFPLPVRMGQKRALRWPWMDCVAFAWWRSRQFAGPHDGRRRGRRR